MTRVTVQIGVEPLEEENCGDPAFACAVNSTLKRTGRSVVVSPACSAQGVTLGFI